MLQQMAAAGVQEVEIADYHPNFNYFNARWLKSIGKAARDAGLAVATVHTHLLHYDPELSLMHSDPVRHRRAVEAYLRAVDALALLGARCLLTHDVQLTDEPGGNPAERERAIAAVREIADYAAAANISLALENVTRGWSSRVANLVGFVEEVNHPAVRMCYDVAHACRADDPVTALRGALAHVNVLHINDQSRTESHLLPGKGDIPWDGVMAALSQAQPDVHFIYELADAAELGALASNFEWLHGLGARGANVGAG